MFLEVKSFYRLAALCAFAVVPALVAAADDAKTAAQQVAIQAALQRGNAFWQQIATDEPRPTSGCRQIFGYILTLCEARVHPERLERLLTLARQMQERDPKSKNWGNYRWCWRDADITDTNAVEFSMQDALLTYLRHGGWMPPAAKERLVDLMRLGVEGCLRHRVPTDYTNIAILNAGNLIVLGEQFNRSDAAREGYRRLDALCVRTAVLGVHEFCSPTYYGTDLNGLLLIHTHARADRQRRQAEALLRLFWTDIAANWFPAALRLGGCHSRSYDYLRGLGGLDWHFWVHGWLESPSVGSAERREPWTDEWSPPPPLAEMGRGQFPRWVREHWGLLPAESRSQMLYRDVALSCCGAGYSGQDSTLVVDLPGSRELPRCYFIADGREDPYGKKTLETGSARHPKALHMQPFWAGTQRSSDALGLVIYRGRDLAATEVVHVQSHFVLRRTADIWLDGRRLVLPEATIVKPARVPIPPGESLVLRYDSAAVAVSVPWSVVRSRVAETVNLIDDGNPWNCLRLTVDHGRRADFENAEAGDMIAGAAFWVRIASELHRDADFDAWRKEFDRAMADWHVEGAPHRVAIEVPGKDGPVSIAATPPWDQGGRVQLVPKPYQGVLEVNGKELGRSLLTAVEPLCSLPPRTGPLQCITVPAGKAISWEAESGMVLPGMEIGEDRIASGHRYVKQMPSPLGQPSGIVTWSLAIEKADHYWLWARVRSAVALHALLYLQVIGEDGAVMPAATWTPRSSGDWQWQPLDFNRAPSTSSELSNALYLSKGVYRLQLQTRRSGAMIDQLMLTTKPKPF